MRDKIAARVAAAYCVFLTFLLVRGQVMLSNACKDGVASGPTPTSYVFLPFLAWIFISGLAITALVLLALKHRERVRASGDPTRLVYWWIVGMLNAVLSGFGFFHAGENLISLMEAV